MANKTCEKRRGYDKVAEETKDLIVKYWQQLTSIVFIIVISVVVKMTADANASAIAASNTTMKEIKTEIAKKDVEHEKIVADLKLAINDIENTTEANSDKNYKLWMQVQNEKQEKIKVLDKLDKLLTAITEVKAQQAAQANAAVALQKSNDDRYALRKELDARHFKTAYRNE